MNRAVIVCGAKIKDYEFVSSFFMEGDFFIYCDSGLIHEDRFLSKSDTKAGLIIGDFDSHQRPERDVEIIELPTVKDDTDSIYAIKEAISRGYKDILIVGAIGDRFDHSLVNVYALMLINDLGVSGKIVDDYSEMTLVDNRIPVQIDSKWRYFSLIAISGTVSGVTIKNAKYNLDNATINPKFQYAISNEVAGDEPAKVSVEEGVLLLIKDRSFYPLI